MKTFPMFLKMTGRAIVVIGGGEQAAQKARLALKTQAALRIVAAELDPELADLVRSGRARRFDPMDPELFVDAALVFVATGCKGSDAAWHGRAKAEGAVVNVVDYPDLCDAMTPSIVDRDPVVVAIGTEGTAPLLGRQIKTRVEEILHPALGAYAAIAGRLRPEVANKIDAARRRDFWRWVFSGAPWQLFSAGRERDAIREIKTAIRTGHRQKAGHLCIVLDAQNAAMLPMAAVQRMQEADIIFVDKAVPEGLLELARRDAERKFVETSSGSQPKFALINHLANSAKSRNVVYLSVGRAAFDLRAVLPPSVPSEQLLSARCMVADQTPQFDIAAAG